MLIRFWVQGYRCFGKKTEIDLTNKKKYIPGKECFRKDLLDKTIVVGNNSTGKTSLGYAMTDIVSTVGGFTRDIGQRNPRCFLNRDVPTNRATFHYEFSRGSSVVYYEYSKGSPDTVISESLKIDRHTVFEYDLANGSELFLDPSIDFDIPIPDGRRSLILAVAENMDLGEDSIARTVYDFARQSVYCLTALMQGTHIGLDDCFEDPERFIVQSGQVELFQQFLNDVCSTEMELEADDDRIMIRKGDGSIPFMESVSREMVIVCHLYAWMARCDGENALIYFDDFDDVFDQETAERTIETIVSQSPVQCVFATHNTGLEMDDNIRPDCCFTMSEGALKPMTDKDSKKERGRFCNHTEVYIKYYWKEE